MHTVTEDARKLKVLMWIAAVIIVTSLAITFPWGRVSPVPLLLSLLALGAAVAIPIALRRRRLSFMLAWFVAYAIAYGVLSWHGAYIDANLGGNDNRCIWYPAHCGEAYRSPSGRQKSGLQPLGWFFLPLVIADRWFVHRTQHDVF